MSKFLKFQRVKVNHTLAQIASNMNVRSCLILDSPHLVTTRVLKSYLGCDLQITIIEQNKAQFREIQRNLQVARIDRTNAIFGTLQDYIRNCDPSNFDMFVFDSEDNFVSTPIEAINALIPRLSKDRSYILQTTDCTRKNTNAVTKIYNKMNLRRPRGRVKTKIRGIKSIRLSRSLITENIFLENFEKCYGRPITKIKKIILQKFSPVVFSFFMLPAVPSPEHSSNCRIQDIQEFPEYPDFENRDPLNQN